MFCGQEEDAYKYDANLQACYGSTANRTEPLTEGKLNYLTINSNIKINIGLLKLYVCLRNNKYNKLMY